MLNDFTKYVLAERRNALWVVLICSFLPVVNSLAQITMCLVTLQHGLRPGLECLVTLVFANVLMLTYAFAKGLVNSPLLSIESLFYMTVCCFGATWLLRTFKSWFLTIEAVCYLGLFAVLMIHLFQPDYHEYWMRAMSTFNNLSQSLSEGKMISFSDQQLHDLARRANGIRSLLYTSSILLYILIARWLQVRLYSPGQLRKELHLLRADYVSVTIIGAVLLGAFFDLDIARDMYLVAIIPLSLVGLSIIHHFAYRRSHNVLLLLSFYMVFSMFGEPIIGLLLFIAVLDLFFNLRGKYDGHHIT